MKNVSAWQADKGGEEDIQKKAKAISNWMLGDFTRLLNLENMRIEECKSQAAGIWWNCWT